MPKRLIDFEAMWASDKLAACAEWAQVEYAWVYGLADANGSFELTNVRVIWGRSPCSSSPRYGGAGAPPFLLASGNAIRGAKAASRGRVRNADNALRLRGHVPADYRAPGLGSERGVSLGREAKRIPQDEFVARSESVAPAEERVAVRAQLVQQNSAAVCGGRSA